ncbi:MAG: carbohydrate kinase family protein [Synergistaceae bacterium]|jgi:sugar/nucleoside kinase (ribokinase family)|nr:carbohydrate kinase family protein [Synergistaceae bacterium]
MRRGIVAAGSLIVDTIKLIDAYPKPGTLANIRGIGQCVGGLAANTVIDIAVMDGDIPLASIGKIGDDELGALITNTLKRHGVDSSRIIRSEYPTSFTDVMNDMSTGERTFFHERGANARFGIEDIDFDAIEAEYFHVGYALLLDKFDADDPEYGTVMARALHKARAMGMKTSLDVVSENSGRFRKIVTPSLKYCTNVIINELEAGLITDIPPRDAEGRVIMANLRAICGKIKSLGVEQNVVIHMPECGAAVDEHGKFSVVGSYELPAGYVKGSVGAGDAFCAGMLYSMYKGFDMPQALKFANGAAALCLSNENAIDGMGSAAEIDAITFPQREIDFS